MFCFQSGSLFSNLSELCMWLRDNVFVFGVGHNTYHCFLCVETYSHNQMIQRATVGVGMKHGDGGILGEENPHCLQDFVDNGMLNMTVLRVDSLLWVGSVQTNVNGASIVSLDWKLNLNRVWSTLTHIFNIKNRTHFVTIIHGCCGWHDRINDWVP